MDKLLSVFGDVNDPRAGGGDSFCDRLNCKFTVYVLILFSILITTRMYVGDQVSCWCPSHFTSSHRDYTNQVRMWCHACPRLQALVARRLYLVVTKFG